MEDKIASLLRQQFNHRIYTESIPRIVKVLGILTPEQVWYAPNSHANSIGHLILHLCGNVTQWIGSGVGERADDRQRDLEFTTTILYSHSELEERLWHLQPITDKALANLKDADLSTIKNVQGFEENILSIIVHVVEHFSYHTGQIAIIAKYLADQDLGFYEGLDLAVTS